MASKIVLYCVVALCSIVLIWAFMNGNKLSFKKDKDGKHKKKKTAEEKYKDVIPEEKKKKEKTIKEPKINESVNKDIEKQTDNKVVKISEEDFKNSNLEVPDSLKSNEEKEKEKQQNISKKESSFNNNIEFPDELKFDSSLKNDFINFQSPLDFDDIKDLDNSQFDDNDLDLLGLQDEFNDNSKMNFNDLMFLDQNQFMQQTASGEDRYSQVFGSLNIPSGVDKEIIIGDIMAGPRARTSRERRKEILKKLN